MLTSELDGLDMVLGSVGEGIAGCHRLSHRMMIMTLGHRIHHRRQTIAPEIWPGKEIVLGLLIGLSLGTEMHSMDDVMVECLG